ncbi:Zinc-type alcohol dehydrogenase-like protein [Dickeya solani]|nr:Zinc-type alcohol dehydrogenase-like protein [Dickeya solani]
MTVKAIAVDPKHPENFVEITTELPQPGEHDLLVAVKAVSVNPVDTKVHAGLRRDGLQHPRILGWDASGVVIETGSAVSGFKPGTKSGMRVISHALAAIAHTNWLMRVSPRLSPPHWAGLKPPPCR